MLKKSTIYFNVDFGVVLTISILFYEFKKFEKIILICID